MQLKDNGNLTGEKTDGEEISAGITEAEKTETPQTEESAEVNTQASETQTSDTENADTQTSEEDAFKDFGSATVEPPKKKKYGLAWILYCMLIYPIFFFPIADQLFGRFTLGFVYELVWIIIIYNLVIGRRRVAVKRAIPKVNGVQNAKQ